jgi:hypothetical protein
MGVESCLFRGQKNHDDRIKVPSGSSSLAVVKFISKRTIGAIGYSTSVIYAIEPAKYNL